VGGRISLVGGSYDLLHQRSIVEQNKSDQPNKHNMRTQPEHKIDRSTFEALGYSKSFNILYLEPVHTSVEPSVEDWC